jgi:hypothetical protein
VTVNISYLHLGGRAYFEGDARNGGGYVVGGLGATFLLARAGGLSDEVRASANLGIGWEWPLARNVALRTELRGYLTLINSSGQFFCSGGCVVSIRGDTLVQAEGMVGCRSGSERQHVPVQRRTSRSPRSARRGLDPRPEGEADQQSSTTRGSQVLHERAHTADRAVERRLLV